MRRFLIISDIHACDVDPSSSAAPSYVSSFHARASARFDPISELARLVEDHDLAPDAILCAGDITNRSNPTGLNYAWGRLNELASGCGASLIATVGNHDLDSRYLANKFDPRGYAMSLAPTIPTASRDRYLEFWSENFTIIRSPGCNIVVLNTAAYHGGGKNSEAEIEHGRVSDVTLSMLERELKSLPSAPVNVLLCHHHPLKGDLGDVDLAGLTRGGEGLVALLDADDASWVIVHGHKHRPELFYGHGGGNSPVILSAASFSAQVNSDAQNKNPNQVHLLVFEAPGQASGDVLTWTWQPGVGWRTARSGQGLPYRAGFGFRGNARLLAQAVDQFISESGVGSASWSDVVTAVPEVARMIPSDFERFERMLDSSHGLSILSERDGTLAQIGRKI